MHKRFTHLIEAIYHRPWLITPGGYAAVKHIIDPKIKMERWEMPMPAKMEYERPEMEVDENNIAHICVEGTMAKGISQIEAICGGYDYEWLEEDLETVARLGVKGVFMEFDSPGGSCEGNAECTELIQDLARRVPVVAYSDGTCASAAYNMAASCSKIYGSPSSTWGSIGTIIPWVDESQMWAGQGLNWQPITNAEGDLKGAGMGPTLSAAQRASLQEYCQDAFEQFRGNVLRNRRVPAEAMRGQAFFAPRALENNLIDGLMTEQAAYEKLLAMLKK